MERTRVVIVGAGPAGLVLAHVLRRAGVPFVVLERRSRAEVAGAPKAGAIEHRTVELLRREGIAPVDIDFTVENHRCEFRTPTDSVVLDYGALTGGRPHYVYAQHLLVEQLCATLLAAGGEVRFGATVDAVTDRGDGAEVTHVSGDGTVHAIGADVVVGCDGARSTVARALTASSVTEVEIPVRWLASIAAAPPLVPHTVYGAHPRGFAGQMRRGPEQTRYYLEVPATDTVDAWPEDRIRAELGDRLGVRGQLDGVAFGDVSLVDLRVRVTEPMQQGALFVAGDAAHLITPAGGKGMNLAVHDAVELAHGIVERFGPTADGARLAAYSATRLREIWRTQAFSYWFLNVILGRRDAGDDRTGLPAFLARTRDGWITSLLHDPLLATWFAHAYAGVDPR